MNPHVRKAVEYLKISSRMERKPGFGHALGFSFHHLEAKHIRFDDRKTCHIRMPVTESLLWTDHATTTESPGMLSTMAAIVDEATTLALSVVDRPGVSVMLSMDAGPAMRQLRVGDEIEVTSFVQKTGRNMGYTKAEIRLVPTGQLVCSGTHIKFLNNLGYVGGFLFSSYGWPLLKAYSDYINPTNEGHPIKTLTELFASLESDGKSKATFSASPGHSSLGGPLHGGAQAVLLERAVESILPSEPDVDFRLDSMQVEYISKPNFHPEIVMTKNFTDRDNQLVISAELWSRGKLSSTGIFRYSRR